jgi:fructose-1-phosphate kinase PfkB-like protein
MIRSRADHMAWAKARAIEYVEAGDAKNALASLLSDLSKHPDTAGLAKFATAAGLLHVNSVPAMRSFVEGFAE